MDSRERERGSRREHRDQRERGDRERERDRDRGVNNREDSKDRRRRRERGEEREREGERDRDRQRHRHSHSHSHSHSHRHREERSERDRHRDSHRDRDRDRDKDKDRGSHRSSDRHRHHDTAADATSSIPTSASLDLTSHPALSQSDDPAALPSDVPATQTHLARDQWMVAGGNAGGGDRDSADVDVDVDGQSGAAGGDDFFSSLGQVRVRAQAKADAEAAASRPNPDELQVSSRELNTQFKEGKSLDEYAQPEARARATFGAPGYQWRMMKLRKTYEQADEEKRSVDDVALERYGDLQSWREAQEERDFLDRRGGKRGAASGRGRDRDAHAAPSLPQRTFMFTDSPAASPGAPPSSAPPSRPLSQQSFRKPGEASAPSTPAQAATPTPTPPAPQQSKPSTPIPSVFTPTLHTPAVPTTDVTTAAAATTTQPPLDAEALNKLEAKVLKAELMGKGNAASLRAKLERERARATDGGDKGPGYFEQAGSVPAAAGHAADTQVQVLPTLDGRGRLYDIGASSNPPGEGPTDPLPPGNKRRRKRPDDHFETRGGKTGEVVRYSADDDARSLADLVREERFKAGASSAKDFDAELASRIATDGAFKEDFDYLEENAERLARKKMRSDALKRQFAVDDYAKTKRALESCRYCWRESEGEGGGEKPPLTRVVASGTRAYLALPEVEPLVDGHCYIVPVQHHLCMLEADDDTWDEVRNFMKCLIQQYAPSNRGLLFTEVVLSLSSQRHTLIEALPLPHALLAVLPGTFRAELDAAEEEWSTHAKVLPFSRERPFRRAMVPHLPYFCVLFDHRGEKGYGHVIESEAPGGGGAARAGGGGRRGRRTQPSREEEEDGGGAGGSLSMGMGMGGARGAPFERYFAAEVVGGLLELEPRRWRAPRRLGEGELVQRWERAKREWAPWDWTGLLRQKGKGGEGEGEGKA